MTVPSDRKQFGPVTQELGKGVGRCLFAFALPTEVEFKNWKAKKVPSTRLWGLVELGNLGERPVFCRGAGRVFSRLGASGWRIWQTAWLFARAGKADVIVGVHEISLVFLLLLRVIGIRRGKVILMNLGLLHPKHQSGLRKLVWRVLLNRSDSVISLVEAQNHELKRLFGVPAERLHFIPMLVDSRFYEPVDAWEEERFCLAVGTNDGKDFETLLSALPLGERLVIVTDSYNAEKIKKHRCYGAAVEVYENVPALDLRSLYRRAAVLVIPLSDTSHGSGHSVLLEGMALGKLVIVSATRSMVGYVRDGQNALLVSPGDVKGLRETLVRVLERPEEYASLRKGAALDARNRFDSDEFAKCLQKIVRGLRASEEKPAVRGESGAGNQKREGVNNASLS